jgi:hypothetical protein
MFIALPDLLNCDHSLHALERKQHAVIANPQSIGRIMVGQVPDASGRRESGKIADGFADPALIPVLKPEQLPHCADRPLYANRHQSISIYKLMSKRCLARRLGAGWREDPESAAP